MCRSTTLTSPPIPRFSAVSKAKGSADCPYRTYTISLVRPTLWKLPASTLTTWPWLISSYRSSVVAHRLLKYTSDNTSTNGGSKQPQRISIQDISDMTYIMNQDIVLALQSINVLAKEEIKEEEGSTSRASRARQTGPTVRNTISLPRIQEWQRRRQGVNLRDPRL